MAKYCSECGTILHLTNKCTKCGHIDSYKQPETDSIKCEYVSGNRQCPALGTISPSVNGGGRWYCSAHYRTRHNKKEADAILDDYLANGVPFKKDWRDELLEQFNNQGNNKNV